MALYEILNVLYYLFMIYGVICVISIFLTWVPDIFDFKFPRMIRDISDWYLGIFRNRGIVFAGMDFGPWIGMGIFYYAMDLIKFASFGY